MLAPKGKHLSTKYLNSPETEVFQKGKLLFNENNCKKNVVSGIRTPKTPCPFSWALCY